MTDRLTLTRLLVAVFSGWVLSILAPPLNLHQLQWFAYLPMFWVLRDGEARSNRWMALAYGTVAVAAIFYWIVHTIRLFSNIPTPGAFAILLLFSTVFGLPYLALWTAVHPLRRRLGDAWIFALPAWLVVVEFVSNYVLLFPYQQGVAQYQAHAVFQLASVTGIWGVSYLVMFFNCALAEAIYRHREGRPMPRVGPALAVAAWALSVAWGTWRFNHIEAQLRDAPVVKIAQLQSSHGMEWRMSNPTSASWREWLQFTEQLQPREADIIVWPEGACPYDLQKGRARDRLAELARELDTELVIGGGTREREKDPEMGEFRVRQFNSVYFFERDGDVAGRYDKMVPLPFGEYFPLAETLPWLANMIEGPGDFRAGDTPVVFEGDHARMAAPICYEAILGPLCRSFEDVSLLINVTNDAWFGDTSASILHGMLAVIRSTELGIPLYRSAYTGISMVAEPHGVIHSQTPLFEEVSRVVGVRLATVPTLYGRFGDWFPMLCAGGLVLAGVASRRR